jgi:hypothetical protein
MTIYSRELYRMTLPDAAALQRELNFYLPRIGERLDVLEGLRGDVTVYSNVYVNNSVNTTTINTTTVVADGDVASHTLTVTGAGSIGGSLTVSGVSVLEGLRIDDLVTFPVVTDDEDTTVVLNAGLTVTRALAVPYIETADIPGFLAEADAASTYLRLDATNGPLTGALGARQIDIASGYGLTVDGTTLVVNASGYADRVGIGTATPASALDVVDTISVDGTQTVDRYGTSGLLVGAYTGAAPSGNYTFYAGDSAGSRNTAANVTAVGYQAGYQSVAGGGANQSLLGYYSGRDNTGTDVTAHGYYAGYCATAYAQDHSSWLGSGAGMRHQGTRNSGLGYRAGYMTTAGGGSRNCMFGITAGQDYTGSYACLFGEDAGKQVSTGAGGDYLLAFGPYAGNYYTGANSVLLGQSSGLQSSPGAGGGSVVGVGAYALQANTAANVTAVGYQAGYQSVAGGGVNSVHVGYRAGYQNTADYQINLGYRAGYGVTTASRMYIGYNAPVTYSAILYGELPNSVLRVNASTINLRYANTGGTEQATTVNVANAHASSAVGFFGVTAATRVAAYTQTYSTASRTHPALTSAALTDSTGGTADTTVAALSTLGDSPVDADALRDDLTTNWAPVLANNFADLIAQVNALRVDLEATKKVVNQLIDDGQIYGLLQ